MRKRAAWLVGLWIVCLLGAGCTSRETVAFETAPEELPAVQGAIIPLSGKQMETIDVKCKVVTISFSAHSDFPGTSSFIQATKPERVVLGGFFGAKE